MFLVPEIQNPLLILEKNATRVLKHRPGNLGVAYQGLIPGQRKPPPKQCPERCLLLGPSGRGRGSAAAARMKRHRRAACRSGSNRQPKWGNARPVFGRPRHSATRFKNTGTRHRCVTPGPREKTGLGRQRRSRAGSDAPHPPGADAEGQLPGRASAARQEPAVLSGRLKAGGPRWGRGS